MERYYRETCNRVNSWIYNFGLSAGFIIKLQLFFIIYLVHFHVQKYKKQENWLIEKEAKVKVLNIMNYMQGYISKWKVMVFKLVSKLTIDALFYRAEYRA